MAPGYRAFALPGVAPCHLTEYQGSGAVLKTLVYENLPLAMAGPL